MPDQAYDLNKKACKVYWRSSRFLKSANFPDSLFLIQKHNKEGLTKRGKKEKVTTPQGFSAYLSCPDWTIPGVMFYIPEIVSGQTRSQTYQAGKYLDKAWFFSSRRIGIIPFEVPVRTPCLIRVFWQKYRFYRIILRWYVRPMKLFGFP